MRDALALAALIAVAACAAGTSEEPQEQPDTASGQSAPDASTPQSTQAASNLPDACERDANSQLACFLNTFELEQCDGTTALSSMFKDTEAEGTYEHVTLFGVSDVCLDELKGKALTRGLRENDRGEFAGEIESGYREALIIGMQTSKDGTVIQWERTKP
ncbi:MAG: hypothetical protein AAF127_01170 [Pseudomonadota bacterium]